MSPRDRAPGSPASLRTANLHRVLAVLRRGAPHGEAAAPVTQATLARLTGLAPATVSSIVRDLAARELVETEPGSGRRGTTVQLARGAGIVAGIDFGHSHLAVAFGDLTGAVVAERRVPLGSGHDWEDGVALARTLLEELLARHDHDLTRLRGITMALPAPVTDGVVRSSAILPGWVGVRATDVASQRFGLPVHVENDANLGALAEHRLGVARGETSSVFIKISSGIGAGIVIEDSLHRGSTGAAGEIGHLTLDDQGPMCRCGSRGCLEAYASVPAVVAMMAPQLPGAGIDDLVTAAGEGNVAAIRTFEDAGLHLGWGLASIVNLLNPALVVVGGDMARAGELLLEPARIGLRRHALDAVAATPVLASHLGERASLAGAVLQAAERIELALD
ncbi:ROK family transcriptional regulator [Nocardioides sp. 616]|uniref:ROK family transcriptional regulator n=1 Tax=Nocardioides sp. 616 TaxID=2268090 RepID=UPI000CE43AE9|nr:ROK family transcriptional regulator [Nocardioides sp. 616]